MSQTYFLAYIHKLHKADRPMRNTKATIVLSALNWVNIVHIYN